MKTAEAACPQLSILRLLLNLGDISAPYHQFTLPRIDYQDITLCTYFTTHQSVPDQLTLFEGDNSIAGYWHVLQRALTARRYDVIHAHSPHVGLLFLLANARHGNPYGNSAVYTAHNSFRNYKLRNRLLLLPAFAFFARIVLCSYAARESFPAMYTTLAGDRIRVVQNGLNLARVDAAMSDRNETDSPDSFTIISINRLERIKNLFTLLEAFQTGSNGRARLQLIGPGSLYDALSAHSISLAIDDRVEMTGLIPRDDVYERLHKADLFISTSYGEGLPIAVLEAMAARCPVILSDIPPHREIAQDAGFIPLVPPDDVQAFAREIRRVRQISSRERASLGQRCRFLVERRFGLDRMHSEYDDVYRELLGSH